jgi:long-chain acyl-CoA synthetase
MPATFARLRDQAPGAVAAIEGATGAITTRAALAERAAAFTTRLRGAGLEEGEFLAVQLPNSVDFLALFLASLQLRLVLVPMDRDARESEVAAVLNQFSIRAFAYRGADTAAITIRDVAPATARGSALMKLSSGSTGRPKGILTSQANLVADCVNICRTMGIRPDDLNFGAIPFSHSYGFSNLVTPLFVQGTPVVIANDYLPLSMLDLCNRHRCTVFPGIPMMFDYLAQLPPDDGHFESVRTFISAGAPLAASTSHRFHERFLTPIHTFYGCSECGGIAYDRDGGAVERAQLGLAMDGVRISLHGAQKRLVVESDAVALGYLHGSAEDAARFARRRFLTDDIGEIGPDQVLQLRGRIGDLINTAGKKVNPREIEIVILQVPGVHQAKVYGEAAGARGEVVAAAVVADPGVTREQIREHCRVHLSSHKVPRIVKLTDAIPVDERGKVKRSALAAL